MAPRGCFSRKQRRNIDLNDPVSKIDRDDPTYPRGNCPREKRRAGRQIDCGTVLVGPNGLMEWNWLMEWNGPPLTDDRSWDNRHAGCRCASPCVPHKADFGWWIETVDFELWIETVDFELWIETVDFEPLTEVTDFVPLTGACNQAHERPIGEARELQRKVSANRNYG